MRAARIRRAAGIARQPRCDEDVGRSAPQFRGSFRSLCSDVLVDWCWISGCLSVCCLLCLIPHHSLTAKLLSCACSLHQHLPNIYPLFYYSPSRLAIFCTSSLLLARCQAAAPHRLDHLDFMDYNLWSFIILHSLTLGTDSTKSEQDHCIAYLSRPNDGRPPKGEWV